MRDDLEEQGVVVRADQVALPTAGVDAHVDGDRVPDQSAGGRKEPVVAVLGAMLPDPAALGVAPATLAFACMLSWGLAVGITPMSASALATARWASVTPWRATTIWNARFTAVNLVLCWTAIALAHVVLGPG
jgi:hypothetical protein